MINSRGESVLSGEGLVLNDKREKNGATVRSEVTSFFDRDILKQNTRIWMDSQESFIAQHYEIDTSELRQIIKRHQKQELIAKARQKTYSGALHKWGMEAQVFMAVEEMAELTKELCKVRRGKEDKAGLIDEIADVTIMLEQLQFMFGIEKQDIEKRMAAKIALLQIRIEE